MKTMILCLFCFFIIGSTNKPKQEEIRQAPINNVVGINDTLKAVVIDTAIILFSNLLIEAKDTKEIYLTLTEKPEFPGGMHELISFIQKNIQYPPNAYEIGKQGRVIVQATIDTDGSVIQPSIIYSADSLLNKEALRIIQSMPKWKPGKYHEKAIKVKYHFPVTFRITDDNTNMPPSLTAVKTIFNIRWGHVIDGSEGVIKIYFNKHINKTCHEKTDDITINNTSISNGKVYVSIVSPKFELTYDEAVFYRENRHGQLHKISKDESVDKESVALMIEKGKAAEIKADFPKNCPTGDYLLKIKVHNEQGERYEIDQWFEAYTSKRTSRRKKPILIGTGYAPVIGDMTEDNEDDVFEMVQNMPEFPGGGMPKLMEFIQDNLQYEKAKDGNSTKKRIIAQIIIDKDGAVIHPKIIRGVNPTLDKEALRVLSLMPKWKPGSQHEIPVKVRFTLPIVFDSPADTE